MDKQKVDIPTRKWLVPLILSIVIPILFFVLLAVSRGVSPLVLLSDEPVKHSSQSAKDSITKCDWCGHEEYCHKHKVKILKGYKDDGSFDFDYDEIWLSDDCLKKAKSEGVYKGWIEIK